MTIRSFASFALACALALQIGVADAAKKGKEKKPPPPPATHEICHEAMGAMMGTMKDGHMMMGKGHTGMGKMAMCPMGNGCKDEMQKMHRDVAWCPQDGQCIGMGLKNDAKARGFCGGYVVAKKACKTGKEKECSAMRLNQRRMLRVMIEKTTRQLRIMGDKHPAYKHIQARLHGLEDLLYTVERDGK